MSYSPGRSLSLQDPAKTRENRIRSIKRRRDFYEIEGVIYRGFLECYEEFFSKRYPELGYRRVERLLRRDFLSQENRERYPELDPSNPYKIWERRQGDLSLSQKSKGDGLLRKGNDYGLIYYLVDRDFNRYYNFTVRPISKEMEIVFDAIEKGYIGWSSDSDDYAVHVYDLVRLKDQRDGNARRKIDSLIRDFVRENPDRRAANLIDRLP